MLLLPAFIFLGLTGSFAQEADNWDNQLFVGTKFAYAKDQWRYSGEFQSRFKENFSALDNWFVEGVATWLPSKHWEIVPDLRISRKAASVEFRPGAGVLFKVL